MRQVSILIVGVGALSVIISLLIPKPTSNQDYWTDEQQGSLDEARNRAHHLSDHHGDATKEKEYQEALVVFKAEQGNFVAKSITAFETSTVATSAPWFALSSS